MTTKTKSFKIFNQKYPSLIRYPFKSKISKLNPDNFIINPTINHEPFVHDYKLKPCLKLSKPDFSPEPGCWEVDLLFTNYIDSNNDDSPKDVALRDAIYTKKSQIYLVMVNTNTRYLIVEPIKDRERQTILDAYKNIYDRFDDFKFNFIKCDGESNLTIGTGKKLVDSSKYTNSHKIVDATIRTIRNAFGLDSRKIANPLLMQQMVHFYNNTPHSALKFRNYRYYEDDDELDKYMAREPKWIYYTPNQMQHNPDLEWQYIRQMKLKLRRIKEQQKLKGLLNYQPGNIILVHLDLGKGEKKHEKQRRIFNELAEFINYENGNVKCKLLNPYRRFKKNNESWIPYTKESNLGRKAYTDEEIAKITVPIIFTKYIAPNIESLSKQYKDYFIV